MGYYVTLNEQADITGLYLDEPGYQSPPPGAVAVDYAIGEQLRSMGTAGKRYIGGQIVVNPSKAEQITALLAPVGLTQAWQLDAFMGGALARAVQLGLTEADLIAANAAYAQASAIRTQILAILAAP